MKIMPAIIEAVVPCPSCGQAHSYQVLINHATQVLCTFCLSEFKLVTKVRVDVVPTKEEV